MSIRERFQQMQGERERQQTKQQAELDRQKVERAKAERFVKECEHARQLAREAKEEEAENTRIMGALKAVKVDRMVGEVALILNAIMGADVGTKIDVRRDGETNHRAVGLVIEGSGPHPYDRTRLGLFVDSNNTSEIHVRGGKDDSEMAQFSLNDGQLSDKLEFFLAMALLEPEGFSWNIRRDG